MPPRFYELNSQRRCAGLRAFLSFALRSVCWLPRVGAYGLLAAAAVSPTTRVLWRFVSRGHPRRYCLPHWTTVSSLRGVR